MRVLALALVVGCATGSPAVRPLLSDEQYLRALGAGACADGADTGCCDGAEAHLRAARESGDDQTADETLEALAISCPKRRAGLLARKTARAKLRGKPAVHVTWVHDVRLPDEDRVYWVGTYVDRTRPAGIVTQGRHEVHVEVHVMAGAGPTKGRLFKLNTHDQVDFDEAKRIWIRLTRVNGEVPFQLSTLVTPFHPGRPGRVGGGGVVGGVLRSERRGYEVPTRTTSPVFEPPPELRDAGASALQVENFRDQQGRPVCIELGDGPAAAHPRHTGAVIDFVRRLAYEPAPTTWDDDIGAVAEVLHLRLDGSFPLGRQGGDSMISKLIFSVP